MKRRIAAKIAGAALAIQTLAATPGFPAGFERATVPDPEGPPLEAGIWYPSGAPASPQPLGPYQQTVAKGGEVAGRGLPLIVVSHSTGGSFADHYDTALALAEAGFVVAAVTHTGDNYRDNSGFARIEIRPRHIQALVDYMLASWPRRVLIATARTGMFGFSAGGFTALVAIGGVPDTSRRAHLCCVSTNGLPQSKESGGGGVAGRRPCLCTLHHGCCDRCTGHQLPFTPEALAGIRAPIQLWRGDSDKCFPIRGIPACHDALPAGPIPPCRMPAISSSWRPQPTARARRAGDCRDPAASIARRSIANSIQRWWPSSGRAAGAAGALQAGRGSGAKRTSKLLRIVRTLAPERHHEIATRSAVQRRNRFRRLITGGVMGSISSSRR